MKTNIIKWGICLFLAIFYISCQDEDITNEVETESVSTEKNFRPASGELVYSRLGSEFSKTQAREIFAKTLAVTISRNRNLKSYLYNEASRQFNGDFEILYLMVKDKVIGGVPFHQILLESSRGLDYGEQRVSDDFFSKEILKADPKLTVYIDETYFRNPELYDRPVSVGVQSAEVDDTSEVRYKAYNDDGTEYLVSGYTQDRVLIGIKENERIALINKNTFQTVDGVHASQLIFGSGFNLCDALLQTIIQTFITAIIQNDQYLIVQVLKLNELYRCICLGDCDDPDADGDGVPDVNDDCPNEAGPASNNGCPEEPDCVAPANCHRTQIDKKDEIYKFKFNNCSAYSSTTELFEGKREMRAVIVYSYMDPVTNTVISTDIKKAGSFSKSSLRNTNFWGSCTSTKWVTTNWETFNWDYCTHGEQIKIFWYEEDPGQWGTFNLSVKFKLGPVDVNSSLDIPLKNNDDILGESVVQYCDAATGSGTLYNTGSIQFYYRLKP